MPALFVTFHVKPGRMKEFVEASIANSRGSINGPGCYATSIIQDPDDENIAHVFEVFADDDALEFHHQQDYYKEWEATTNELMSAPYDYVRQSNFPASDSVKFLKRAVGA